MRRILQFRLGCHGLPIATGRFAGTAHVDRAHRVCLSCNAGALGDDRHFSSVLPLLLCGLGMQIFSQAAPTP